MLDDNGLEIARSPTPRPTAALQSRRSDPDLGSPLAIALRPDTKRIAITYRSRPNAGALLWLTPEQTAGKKAPFMFSQGEIDREPDLDPDAGFARHPPDLGSEDPRPSRLTAVM